MKFEENIMKFEVKLNLKKFDESEYKSLENIKKFEENISLIKIW